jgi:hypothetical protein
MSDNMPRVLLAALPASDQIRRKAAEVLQRDEYRPDSTTGEVSESLFLKFIRMVLEAIQGMADSLSFLPDWLRYPVIVALIALLLYVGYRIIRGIAGAARMPERSISTRTRQATAKSPDEYETLAADAMREGRVIEAVRLLFRAGLLRIEQAEKRPLRPGITNRELLRKYRATPIQEPLREMVETIDVKWYGGRPASSDDFDRCQAAYGVLREAIASRTPAPTALSNAEAGAKDR